MNQQDSFGADKCLHNSLNCSTGMTSTRTVSWEVTSWSTVSQRALFGFCALFTTMRLLVCFSSLTNNIQKDSSGPCRYQQAVGAPTLTSLEPLSGQPAQPQTAAMSPIASLCFCPQCVEAMGQQEREQTALGLASASSSFPVRMWHRGSIRQSRVKCNFVPYLCKLYHFHSRTENMF